VAITNRTYITRSREIKVELLIVSSAASAILFYAACAAHLDLDQGKPIKCAVFFHY